MLKCLSVEDLSNVSVFCKIMYWWITTNNCFIKEDRPPFLLPSGNLCIKILFIFYRPLKSLFSRHHCLF